MKRLAYIAALVVFVAGFLIVPSQTATVSALAPEECTEAYLRDIGAAIVNCSGVTSCDLDSSAVQADGAALAGAEKIGAFSGPTITPTAIIIHWTAGEYDTPQEFVGQLQSSKADDSAGNKYPNGRAVQLTVDKDGKVYQLTDTLETRPMQTVPDQTWNDVSIAIEVESKHVDGWVSADYENDILSNATQFNAVASVTKALVQKYNIATTPNLAAKTGIFGHFEIAPNDKIDPGPNYLQKVKDTVASGGTASSTSASVSSASGCSCSATGTFVGSDNIEIAYNFFRTSGLTNEQAAGIVGNLIHESGVMPNRKQGSGIQTISSASEIRSGVGFGIAQWTDGGRQDAWLKFAEDKKADPLDLNLQLQFLLHELETEPSYGLAELKAAGNDLAQATWIFLAFFEKPATVVDAGKARDPVQPTSGPAKDTLDERVGNAQGILETYGGTAPTGGGGGCTLVMDTSEPDYSAIPSIEVDGSPPGGHKESNCTGTFTVGAESLRQFVLAQWVPPVSSVGGYDCRAIVGDSETSLHGLGRALDIMVDSTTPEGLATGDEIRNVLINNAELLGLQRVIWNRKTWVADRDGWRDYNGDNPHTDHLHVEINLSASTNASLAGGP